MNGTGPARVARWAGPWVGSFGDQALFSGANFALNLLLARWLPPERYGSFAVAFAAFLFLSGFYNALILEPMSVLGAQRPKGATGAYVSGLVRLHFVITLPAGAALALGTLMVAAPGDLRAVFLGLALSFPFCLLFWLARSACHLHGSSWRAAAGSMSYAAALLGPLLVIRIRRPHAPGGVVAFLLMAFASIVGSLVAWSAFRRHAGVQPAWKDLLRENWSYGRWVAPTAVVNGAYALAFVPLLAMIAGLAAAGAYRALQNLVLPLQQTLAAAMLLALPRLARLSAVVDTTRFDASARRLVLVVFGASGAYAAGLVLCGPWLLDLLYGSGFFTTLAWAVPFLGVSVALAGLGLGLSAVLRARRRPDTILWAKSAAAVVLLGLGWPAVAALGLRGALWSLVAATAAETLVLAIGTRGTRSASTNDEGGRPTAGGVRSRGGRTRRSAQAP